MGKISLVEAAIQPENLVLPHDLNETYSRYAREFESSDELDSRPVALRTVALLAHGTGSLPLDVVLAAFSLEIQSDKATSRFQKDMEASPGVIVKDCKHMVDIDEELGVVRFVHHSVYEFFKTYKELERQTLIAELSLTYLGSPYFPTWSSRWSERAFLHELMHDNPFLVFASRNWADSVKKSPKKSYEHLMRLLAQVCCVGKHKAGDMAAKGTEEERIVLSFQVYLLGINEDPIPGVHQEHVLSYFSLINCLKDFHEKGALDLHKRDGDGLAAIHWVIRSTAKKNTRAGNTASQLGTGYTRSETCKMVATLIDCGAEVEAADAKGRTPLHYAAWFGKLDVVQLLLDMKAKVDAASEEFGTALQAASFRDHGSSYPHHAKVTETLLKAGASVNSLSKRGTPLHAIAWVGCVDCAERMFERRRFHRRPKKNVCVGDFGTAIHAAAFHGHYKMVDLLLKKGFDPNKMDEGLGRVKFIADRGEYETALNVAASLGHRDFTRALYLFTLQGEWGNNMLEALLKSRVAQVKQHLLNQSSDTGSGFEAAEKLTDVGMELLITALGQGQTHRPLASVIVK
ncbi:putative ankyrin repeat domain containing protein [Diplodia seriata]|uniref:Putative ankyrin repeat domain containing protein n=1 Tax=Diplodia seriata TaxID=420778 RepID=A0A0G2GXJ5_9PEZI|nr:putative ankyrin repeat domain containing protein [Diplodia seriata]